MIVPATAFAARILYLAWTATWVGGGLTIGEKLVQRTYLVSALVFGALSAFAYLSIKRGRRDPAWRWVAWLWTGLAIVALAT